MVGKSTIEDGKVDGDSVFFNISFELQGNQVKTSYKGKVTGDEIALTETIESMGATLEWKGKRTQ
jgi:hypothetical protein